MVFVTMLSHILVGSINKKTPMTPRSSTFYHSLAGMLKESLKLAAPNGML